ncbi:MAG: hypothetical protein M0Z94_01995 [Dehalococcoidales bacterium]|nr:hypothetical protein [Dehalococcoidales bacterium]
MDSLLYALGFLLFPGLLFVILMGVLSAWGLRWLATLARREQASAWRAVFADTLTLGRLGLKPSGRELGATTTALLIGLLATAMASVSIWRAAFSPQLAYANNLIVVLFLLWIPVVGAFYASDWVARGQGNSQGRDALLLIYDLVLLLALFVPAVKVRSLLLGDILLAQSTAGPQAMSWAGGLSFVVALLAARVHVSLLGTLWKESLAEANGAAEAILVQVLRGASTFVLLASLVLLFWAGPGSDALVQFTAFWPKYAVTLALFGGLFEVMRRRQPERVLAYAWIPLALLAVGALALAAGGF